MAQASGNEATLPGRPVTQLPPRPPLRAPIPHGPEAGGRRRARRPLDLARFAPLARTALWLAVTLLILAPCACFLAISVSPRLFSEGSQWFTLAHLSGVLTGGSATALANSIWVGCAAACLGLVLGFPIAWLVHRTAMPLRRLVPGAMWLVLLLPSWMPAIGWQRLVVQEGVLWRLGIHWSGLNDAIMGPFGVVLLLGLRCVPFTYLAVSAALSGLGQEFEDAARVHGASRMRAIMLITPILAPAITSALAIGFAESVSDFGVAATLAYSAHFPLATYQLYSDVYGFPPDFPGAAAVGWLLVCSVAVPLAIQARALRGRSYAVLSGRTRPAVRRELSRRGKLGAVGFIAAFFVLALAVPGAGAISASLLADFGATFQLSFVNFHAVLTSSGLAGPLERSLVYGSVTASVTVVGGFIIANLLGRRRTASTRLLDVLLLAAVALPSVVFAAGYIFFYNLPFFSRIGINIYQTTTLLIVGYTASSLPTNARVLVGAVSQVQSSLHDAGRAHGAGALRAWFAGVFPVISRPLTMAWLLTFTGIFLELPISQLLYAPGSPPASVAINDNLGNYHYGVGMAQAVMAVGIAFVAVAVVLGGYRLFAPKGWRRIAGGTHG